MLLKKGLLLLLSVAAVKSQVRDCSSSNDNSVSTGNQTDALSCPLLSSSSNSSSTGNGTLTTNGGASQNETIFQFLNSTKSPVPKFTRLINSSPDFQPLIDILSNPDNHTLFLPCDEALEQLLSMSNITSNTTSGGSNGTASNSTTSGGTGGGNQTSSIANSDMKLASSDETWTLHNLDQKDKNHTSSGNSTHNGGGKNTTSSGGNQNSTFVISQGLSNFSIVDVLKYHVLNGSWPLSNITHGIHVNDTLMSNQTAYPLADFAPLVIINNSTSMNGTNSTSSGGNSTSSGNNSTSSNATSSGNNSDSALTFLGILAHNATKHNGTNPMNSTTHNSTANITVGNGIGYANIIKPDITTSNGIIHIIDKVLVPPVSFVDALKQLNETAITKGLNETNGSSSNSSSSSNNNSTSTSPTSTDNSTTGSSSSVMESGNMLFELSSFLDSSDNKSTELTSLLNSAKNITIFLPSDQAIKNFTSKEGDELKNASSLDMSDLVKNHIVNGTYYTTNFTENPVSTNTLNGSQIELSSNSNGTIFHVGNATIIKPNILTNEGVIHVIDHVLMPPPQSTSNSTTTSSAPVSSSTSTSTSESQPSTTASSSSSSFGLHLTPSITAGLLCLCFGLLSLM